MRFRRRRRLGVSRDHSLTLLRTHPDAREQEMEGRAQRCSAYAGRAEIKIKASVNFESSSSSAQNTKIPSFPRPSESEIGILRLAFLAAAASRRRGRKGGEDWSESAASWLCRLPSPMRFPEGVYLSFLMAGGRGGG